MLLILYYTFTTLCIVQGQLPFVDLTRFSPGISLAQNTFSTCGQTPRNPYGRIDLRGRRNPSVFRDLQVREIQAVARFLYSQRQLRLVPPEQANSKSNYIYISELNHPSKKAVLAYLDKGRAKPRREARVTIYRGAIPNPDFLEVIVGPLPRPRYVKLAPHPSRPVPAIFGPPSVHQDGRTSERLKRYIDNVAGDMLQELYGGKLTNCGNKCVSFGFRTHISSILSGKRTKVSWYWLHQFVEFYIIHPVDFALMIEKVGEMFKIQRVYLNGRLFNTLPESVMYFYSHRHNFTRIPFPVNNRNLFSSLHQRGQPPLAVPLRNPSQVSPDGKRYNIIDRHVSYMFWEFDVSIGVVNGPQIFDVRYQKQRIVYELSLQEIAALYSGSKPFEQLDLFDSYILLGTLSSYLIPGVDCPSDATFLSSSFHLEVSSDPIINKNAMCVFELNTGLPLRRHHAFHQQFGRFYEGLETTVLVVRTILTVTNYEYFLDYMFYPNGAIEVKAIATGYVTGSPYRPGDENYGFRLHDNLLAPLHTHIFNFKADLDIKGTKNRYRTTKVVVDKVPNLSKLTPNGLNTIYQNKIVHSISRTEKEASMQGNGRNRYLTLINEHARDRYGNAAGYRIRVRDPIELLRPPGRRKEAGLSWARYSIAVTKQKDSEPRSSSMYVFLDDEYPKVNFQTFIDDDEWVVDQDLVTWITLGLYHIPHTEDLPVTHTPGMDSSFILTPYNYFHEDPSMASTNAVRLDLNLNIGSLQVQRYGTPNSIGCVAPSYSLEYMLRQDTCQIFSCTLH